VTQLEADKLCMYFSSKTKCPEKNFNKTDVFEKCLFMTFLKFFFSYDFHEKLNMVKMYLSFVCIEYQYFCRKDKVLLTMF